MAKSFRLTDEEEQALYKKNLNISRELIKIGKPPITESKLLHLLLEQTLVNGDLEITSTGEIKLLQSLHKCK